MAVSLPTLQWPTELQEVGPAADRTIMLRGIAAIAGRPLAINPDKAAFAHGTGNTGTPARIAAAANCAPGSAIPGVPASETIAIFVPAFSSAASSSARAPSLNR